MDTKHIHCMLEKIAEYGKQMMEAGVGSGNVNLEDASKIVDMVKDLAYAEKCARIAKCLRKEDEEEESEQKYLLKRLKEDYKDEYKQMQDEYGEDADRLFYDSWRHADGSFARKGTGEYRPKSYYRRRGYVEPMYHMPLDMYHDYTPEELRDWDRDKGRLYFTHSNMGNSGMNNTSSSQSNGNSGDTRSYSDGFNDGQTRGYSEGYEQGNRDGRSRGGRRDGREGRSGQSRRSYMETKEMNKGNTPEEKQHKMKELEKYMGELSGDITEMISDASNEEKTMLKSKLQTLVQKIN